MARLLNSLLLVETCIQVAVRHLGARSTAGQRLQSALRALRRDVGGRALHDLATEFDPKADFQAILRAAEAAGLSWPDMADALNHYNETRPKVPQ